MGRGSFFCLILFLTATLLPAATKPEHVMTAVRIDGPITIDGLLNEPQWELAKPATDFIQRLPHTGQPATERTEVRLIYDNVNLYVGVNAYDSAGKKGITIKDIKRDFGTLDSDGFQIVIDTFNDDRNSFLFGTNPAGAKFDMQIGADGAAGNTSWNGIWHLKTKITDEGWQVEMAIPFKTLRFGKKPVQIWGVNFERRVRRKHEDSYWSPLPAAFRLGRVSLAGQLEGVEGIHPGRNLYIKPYVTAPVQHLEGDDTDFLPEAGLDLKYALGTQSTLDLTYNTDFSQVEADEQQINLTRFNLFFPEKREFFLENAGIFGFGRSRSGFRTDLIPFFTRRIGISDDNRLVPILGGARFSGREGKNSFGFLNMQTDSIFGVPSTNFSVMRYRRDILAKSDVGALFVDKEEDGPGFNRTFGVDTNFRLFRYLELSSSLLKTQSPEVHGHDMAANVEVAWWDDLLDLEVRHVNIQENFNPEVGFVQRGDMKRTTGTFIATPRPHEHIPWVRYLGPTVTIDYITDQQGELETRLLQTGFYAVLHNGSEFSIGRRSDFERLDKPFQIRPDQAIVPGDYQFNDWYMSLTTDKSRLLYGQVSLQSGEFWDGTREGRAVGLYAQPGYHFSAGATWTHNDVKLPSGPFTTDLISARVGYLFTTNLFLNTLTQYNSDLHEVSTNVRFNFIYRPLADFFLVYNERRASSGEVLDRALIAKLTYMLAF